ncbi:hypothetical protein Pint_17222 [Pistacia integerrima]|uniref:Uncharacterized protein n=1 Tax=Pistacia integerrima TaxID=434235 RepID=A0ACC0YVP1_9ROSI|nr:hypothetical protein Pint_17222 [Pistacia integerrima]
MTKTKRSSVLQKRLQKLESELSIVFSLPSQSSQDHLKISEYIQKRFQFLRKLLSAEIASHPKKPYNLHNITRRLTELETAFTQWENSNSIALTFHHEDFEPVSTCSCSESFVNDDGDASPPELTEKFYEELVEEKVHSMDHESWVNEGRQEEGSGELGWPGFEEAKNFFEGLKDEKDFSEKEVKREKRRGWGGKYGSVLAAGLVLGTALILGLAVVSFSSCFRNVKHNSLLMPT